MAAHERNVGILGSGTVGQSLGRGFAARGYSVMIGTREPEKIESWRTEAPGPRQVGSVADAARHGPIVVLATNGSATEEVVRQAGVGSFDRKLVLDVTNPLDFSAGRLPGLFVGTSDSLGERVQRLLPTAEVVKCFNTVGNSQMVDPKFAEGRPKLLLCGDSKSAKGRVDAIAREFGWSGTIDVGGIEAARWLEALVPLWVRVSMALNTWDGAFSFVK